MRILIAEDDTVSRRVLEATLNRWKYETIVTGDGTEAWNALATPDAPRLLVLDWMMPGMDGIEICARLREREDGSSFYILLLTAKTQKDDIVAGLQAGADDYITKPFHHEELRARVNTGRRLLEHIEELQRALDEVRRLSGLLPICSYCKKIREGDSYWAEVDEYITSHTEAQLSHAVCPSCYDTIVRPQLEELEEGMREG